MLSNAEAAGQLGGRSREQPHEPELAAAAAIDGQRHGLERLDVHHGGPVAERVELGLGHELLAVVGGGADHAGGGIDERLGHRRRHRPPPRGHQPVGGANRFIGPLAGGRRRAEHRVGGHRDLVAGQGHEHRMPGRPLRKPGDRLHTGEPFVHEKPRQFERPAEVAAAGRLAIDRVETQHERAPLGGLVAELPEAADDGGLDLRVAGAGEGQPDRHHDRARDRGRDDPADHQPGGDRDAANKGGTKPHEDAPAGRNPKRILGSPGGESKTGHDRGMPLYTSAP